MYHCHAANSVTRAHTHTHTHLSFVPCRPALFLIYSSAEMPSLSVSAGFATQSIRVRYARGDTRLIVWNCLFSFFFLFPFLRMLFFSHFNFPVFFSSQRKSCRSSLGCETNRDWRRRWRTTLVNDFWVSGLSWQVFFCVSSPLSYLTQGLKVLSSISTDQVYVWVWMFTTQIFLIRFLRI